MEEARDTRVFQHFKGVILRPVPYARYRVRFFHFGACGLMSEGTKRRHLLSQVIRIPVQCGGSTG